MYKLSYCNDLVFSISLGCRVVRQFFLGFGLCCSLISHAMAQDGSQELVRISYFEYAPHIVVNLEVDQVVSGALYDFLVGYIAPEMNIEFVWDNQATNLPRQLALLENNLTDASTSMRRTPERELIADFTSKPYHLVYPVLAVLNDHPLREVNSSEDVIGLNIGYAENNFIPEILRDEAVSFTFVNSSSPVRQSLSMLLESRLDAIYVPGKANLQMELKNLNAESRVRIIDMPEVPGQSFVVFGNDNDELVQRYNQAFDNIGGREKYLEILATYLESREATTLIENGN